MSSKSVERPDFGTVRNFFWPIHSDELKKFLPMGLMMFFILFDYTILRNTKDALVVNASGGSAVIPYLKFGLVLPMSVLFVVAYTKIVNVISREMTFYLVVAFFLAFFAIFGFILYPMQDVIHPSIDVINNLKAEFPRLQHLFSVYQVWSYALFYTLAELWGSAMISLLFWQFANEITRTEEAKRFYAMFGLLANFSLIAAGESVKVFSTMSEDYGTSLMLICGAVTVAGLFVMAIFRWMNTNVLTDPKYYDSAADEKKQKKRRPKLSVGESFKYLLTSKYLGMIAILVIAYGLSINLVELIWKEQLNIYYPNRLDYQAFMGKFSTFTGIATIIMIMLFKGVVKRFGWFTGAIITPTVILVTALLFFGFIFYAEMFEPITAFLGFSTVFMAVMMGAAQNIFSKSSKYSLFDPTKEMAYIPLDQELKVKGKAAVDVIGGRLGKAGGGVIAVAMFTVTAASEVMTIAPFLAGIVFVVLALWMFGVGSLSRLYKEKLDAQEAVEGKK
jgi:AAA family ATP:ADP antiporter